MLRRNGAHEDRVGAFFDARKVRPAWPGIAEQLRPSTIAAGYRLQHAVHARLAAAGDPRVCIKIGSTSPSGQGAFGLQEPIHAGLLASGRSATLAEALARPLRQPSLECEIALVLARDVDGATEDLSDAALVDAVASCHIACEIIDKRYGEPMAVGVPSLIADDFFQVGFVIGSANPDWRSQDLANASAFIDIDGARATGNARDVLSAFAALRWLVRKLASDGERLRAGEIIMTGSITAPTPISLPARDVRLSIDGFEPLLLP